MTKIHFKFLSGKVHSMEVQAIPPTVQLPSPTVGNSVSVQFIMRLSTQLPYMALFQLKKISGLLVIGCSYCVDAPSRYGLLIVYYALT